MESAAEDDSVGFDFPNSTLVGRAVRRHGAPSCELLYSPAARTGCLPQQPARRRRFGRGACCCAVRLGIRGTML
jgi:hypothetical protein